MTALRADRRVGLLLAGVILLIFVAIGATVALPATDPSLDVDAAELSKDEMRGMKLFAGEGCWYCHTQYVRETKGDAAAYGQPLSPDAYGDLSPSMLGLERTGPDMRWIAPATAEAIRKHGRAGSLGYLSTSDLEALASYLARW